MDKNLIELVTSINDELCGVYGDYDTGENELLNSIKNIILDCENSILGSKYTTAIRKIKKVIKQEACDD